jgi:arabinogalactan oligomer/maltooligosaccharide transport system substrate-binding protein
MYISRKALTTTQAIIISIIVIIGIVAGIAYYLMQSPSKGTTTTTPTTTASPSTSTPTTTTSTSSSTTTTSGGLATLTIGNTTIHVPKWLKDYADAASSGQAPKTSIIFGVQMLPFEVNIMKQVAQEFMNEYPSITVDVRQYQDLKSTVQAAVAVGQPGSGPDVFTWAHDWTGELADAGDIIPLDQYLPSQTLNELRSQFLSSAFDAGSYKLLQYGLPWAAESIALIINNNMVPNPPKTFADMKSIMQQYYDPGNDVYGLAYQIDAYHIYPWITAFGGYYYDQIHDKVGVNSTGTKEGLKFFIENIMPYLDSSDLGHEHQLSIFTDGRAPMIITGPWDIPQITSTIGSNITVMPIPPINNTVVPKPFVGVKMLWLTPLPTKDPNRLKAALLFTIWFTLNDKTLKILVDKAGFIPVKLSVLQYVSEHKDKYPIVAGFAQAIASGTPMPNSPKMSKVWTVDQCISAVLQTYVKTITSGGSVQQAIQAAVSIVDSQMDQCEAQILQSMSGSSS